jgi:hypothetical protein
VEMNDVYILDVPSRRWERVECVGQVPGERFAHVSVVYDYRV